jgi:hypothetical protein
MSHEQDQAGNWEEGYLKAQDFLSGFMMKSATVSKEKRAFYSSLTGQVATMMKRDRKFIAGLPDTEKTRIENGSFINYKTDPQARENETRFFTTTRDGWTKTTLGPHISGYQTGNGTRYIELAITLADESPYKNRFYPASNYITMRVYENGLVVGHSANTGSSELQTEELSALTEILKFGKIAVEESG